MDKDYRSSRRAEGTSSADRSQPRRYAVEKQASSGSYAGRFGNFADVASRRPTGSYRSRPVGGYRSRMDYDAARRSPTARTGGDSYTRRPEKAAEPAKPAAPKKRAKDKGPKRRPGRILPAAALLLALAVILILLFGNHGTVHQLPTVERAAQITEAV